MNEKPFYAKNTICLIGTKSVMEIADHSSDSNYERDYLLLCCFCAERKNNTTTSFLFFLKWLFQISNYYDHNQ